MTTVSNIAIGAHLAGNAAAKARHGMNEAIARLSTGVRGMYGGDAASTGAAFQFRAEGASAYVAARNAEDGISFLQAAESVLLELAANSDATAARMMDTDFAKSSANLAKFTVLNQSAMAMVAQANQANSSILAVLQ